MALGREREVAEIVRYKRAAAVGRLLPGELDGPMEPIFVEQYIDRPRRDLKPEMNSIRAYLRGEVAKFCRNNFENVEPEDLARLYEPIFEHKCEWYIPLTDFIRDFGKFKDKVLKGAPPHATVRISPWGLQFDYPEHHLMRDLETISKLGFGGRIGFSLSPTPRGEGQRRDRLKSILRFEIVS